MTVAPEVRAVVRVAYGYHCGYCGVSGSWAGNELEVDHFRPLSRGGTDALDNLEAHILEAANGRLVGLTPRGWFHIRWLHLNRPQLIELRQLRQSEEVIREALAQAQEVKTKLQERIRELELEVARLQEIISRLSEVE